MANILAYIVGVLTFAGVIATFIEAPLVIIGMVVMFWLIGRFWNPRI